MNRKKTRSRKTISIIITTIILLLVLLLDFGGYLSPIKAHINTVINPIRYWTITQSRKVSTIFKDITAISAMKNNNMELKQRVDELESQVVEMNSLERENADLRMQLGVLPEEDYKFVYASIVAGDLRVSNSATIILNKGHDFGIEKYNAVITSRYLVGIINEVYENTSEMLLITSEDINIPVVSEIHRTKGLITGDVESGIIMTKILREESVDVGELVLTSGINGYPKDLIVGKISEVIGQDADTEKVAIIEGYQSIRNLENVFVVMK